MALALAGCGGLGQPTPYDSQGIDGLVIPTPAPDAEDFVPAVDNPWLPLAPGASWAYDVTERGVSVGSIRAEVLDATIEIAGLTATGVHTSSRVKGVEESVTRFYAQDDAGNVWWVGEDSSSITWRAGEDGAQAGLAMPASPRLGDGWLSYVVPDRPRSSALVDEQGRDMISTREETDTTTLKFYESGVGLVGLDDLDAGWQAELVDHRPG